MCLAAADVGNLYLDLEFPEGYHGRPWVALNMVTTVDGKATIAGRTKQMGSPNDRTLMRRIRAAADMVVVGSATLRKEEIDFRLPDYLRARRISRGLPPDPMAATISTDCNLPTGRKFFQDREIRSVVFTVRQADNTRVRWLKRYSQVYFIGDEEPGLEEMMKVLSEELGVKRLVLEGGPTLNAHFIEAGFVDELFWTVAPKIVGGSGLTMVEGKGLPPNKLTALALTSAFGYEDELFLRYKFIRSAQKISS